MFFVGNTQSTKEIAQAIGTDEIVIPRGAQLEEKIKKFLGETNLEKVDY